jgi:hypothetical protein
LDGTLSEKRDKLGKAKATRDTLRQKGRRIKESSVFITNPSLLDDIEVGGCAAQAMEYKSQSETLVSRVPDCVQVGPATVGVFTMAWL